MKIMEIYTVPYLSECLTAQGTYKAMQNNNGNVANRTKCYSMRLEEKREQMITFIPRWGGGGGGGDRGLIREKQMLPFGRGVVRGGAEGGTGL